MNARAVDTLRGRLLRLAREHGLVAINAFGSRATEVAARVAGAAEAVAEHPASDVDIGALPAPGRTLGPRDRVRIAQALEDAFGVERVDLVVLPEAPPFLAVDIVSGEILAATDLLPFERARLTGWQAGSVSPR